MDQNIIRLKPNLVQVTCITKGPHNYDPKEQFVGHLVDEFGNNLETPEIGFPIYLSGDDDKQDVPWLFATDPIKRLEVHPTHWVATTDGGVQYEICNGRMVQ